jgi:hypothetical protein
LSEIVSSSPIPETSQETISAESVEESGELLVTEKPTQSETDEDENNEEAAGEEEGVLVEESEETSDEGSNIIEETGPPLVESENIGGEAEGSVGEEIEPGASTAELGQVVSEEVQISGSTVEGVPQAGPNVDEESSEEGLGIFEDSEEESESQEEEILGGTTIFEGGNQGNLATGGEIETSVEGGQVGISGSSIGEEALELNGTLQISGSTEAGNQGIMDSNESLGINVEEEIEENISEGVLQVNEGGSNNEVSNQEGSIEAETILEGGVSAEGALSIDENEVEGIELSTQGQIDEEISIESSEEQEGGEIEVEDSQIDEQDSSNFDGNNSQEFGNGGLGISGGEKTHATKLFNNAYNYYQNTKIELYSNK